MNVAATVAPLVDWAPEDVAKLIEYPPNQALGDLALPCFRFAKALRKSPQQIAADLQTALQNSGQFQAVEVAGGYVNIRLNRGRTTAAVVKQANDNVAALFSSRRGVGVKVAVDYSAPNIAKEFGVGHLRSTMIGQAIVRILRADGHEVIGINHLGDWGTQFGKNIVAYLRWGDDAVIQENPVRELQKLYVRFHEEAVKHPELEDEARLWFKKLEDGDPEAVRLWQWIINESMKTYEATYRLLGVTFDYYMGESFYNDKMQAVEDELRAKGLLTESEGAEVVDLSAWNMPPCIIRKSDGATIYATRDLAAANYRHDVLGADRLIYVVGAEQTLHFAQVFKVLELMGR
ncbi:MAG: arginine--tRNA ligase, partial [Alicyclobacillus sp.]|nr:arginine--tRNA ligase [Alicyclobacillus sp.]